MQANPSQRSAEPEREDKPTQRAVLGIVLHEFPAQLTKADLKDTVGGGDERERAIRNLSIVGLLWCEGDFVLPTLAARHFDWLELS
jgi:hypothetical protein